MKEPMDSISKFLIKVLLHETKYCFSKQRFCFKKLSDLFPEGKGLFRKIKVFFIETKWVVLSKEELMQFSNYWKLNGLFCQKKNKCYFQIILNKTFIFFNKSFVCCNKIFVSENKVFISV